MNVNGKHYRTVWVHEENQKIIQIINQTNLPHKFEVIDLKCVEDFRIAIKDMHIRGAGCIGAVAGFGMYSATLEASTDNFIEDIYASGEILKATRPTASNLAWAVERMKSVIAGFTNLSDIQSAALKEAQAIADEDAAFCKSLGEHGKAIIEEISKKKKGDTVHILTHCNAGWLAFVDYGSATAPIYAAAEAGIDIHVWVDETRPRNQGARLTAWELGQQGIKHDVIADNVGGHLMQHGMVDMVITGTDRVTRCGDVANKIGTYLKAVAAKDNDVPFYVALPSSTFDFTMRDGLKEIPIEERGAVEVKYMRGLGKSGEIEEVLVCPESSPARNWGFDVTPARLVTKLITERGICDASEEGIVGLYPEEK